ncbi:MBL fold metallo-hydrolase [Phenylobacterium montanum]|uniref:MBL fold metallo-hydrolase n=1 Tax=Phenylobacterium montanum TaxID=2823693 RepID=A0A975FXS2_9CAUL|nr:MBL fold metallo-hydrolase [Caulobacter sp. S6]QUD87111.1 MBL fold metallo-hydrolase [Caulobacter sp. S6]
MIPFVREIEFEYGKPDQVSPLIRRVVANNPGPFTYRGTGVYIVGRGEVAVIDPGPRDEAHLEALLAATSGERITHILTTHTHSDHSPLARPLADRTGAVVIGRPPPGDADVAIRLDEGHEADFRPDIEVADGQVIEGPGWTLEAIATPGHVSNHVCYALREENALFSGDHVMGWSTTVISPPHGDMTDYYASLDKVAARDFSTLWPTHGPPVTEVAPFLAAYKAHRLERETQIIAQIRAGRTRISEMVPVIYAAVDPRLHPAAAHSVLAHIIHLERQGVIAAEGPMGPGASFRAT